MIATSAGLPGQHAEAVPVSGTAPRSLRVLAVGDVIGSPGRASLRRMLHGLRSELDVDFVIANGENSAGGRGITLRTARELRDCGVDVITTGNHVWAHQDIEQALADDDLRLLRPLNYPGDPPGNGVWSGTVRGHELSVVNLMGRVFMTQLDDPFRAMDAFLATSRAAGGPARPRVIVDFHAEATSEKQAMGWYLAGRVSAVFGTHTHVPTADARVLPGETGYVTDLGMVGPRDSIIGAAIEPTMRRFLTQRPGRGVVAEGSVQFNAVLIELDAGAGTCRAIGRVDRFDMRGASDEVRAQGEYHA